jgi:TonB-linked SusC/RagA family outer membrane protein
MKNFCTGIRIPHLKPISKILCIMKVSLFLTMVSTLNVSAILYSQDAKLNLSVKDKSLMDVIRIIEDQSSYRFFFSNNNQGLNDLVSIRVKDGNISQVLTSLLEDKSITYKLLENNIVVITPAEGVQQQIVTGTVTDNASGDPLPGVNIIIKGTSQGTTTDANGKFSLSIPDPNSVLVLSFMGFVTEEIGVSGRSVVDVKMAPDIKQISEVVVTALGIQKQARSLGYSTTEVKGDEFTQARDINLGNALTGKVAGVSVANNATGASGSSRVIIRGNASLTGNNQPLYVVDGVPFGTNTNQIGSANPGYAGQWGGLDQGDGLTNIDPDDIESIQVLKGAAASALYGFRGGNGAILITTKSGLKSKGVEIELNNNLTFNTIIDYRDFQYQYGQGTQGLKPTTASAAFATASSSWGAKIDGSNAVNFLGNTYAYSAAKDNWKNFFQTGINNQTSLSISGNSDQVKYRIGLNNLYNEPYIPVSNIKQQGINLNTVYNINKKLQLTITANYVFEQVKNRALLSDASTNVNATLMYLANTFDVRWLKPEVNADGTEMTPGNNPYFSNPYFLVHKHQNNTERNRLTGAATLKYTILDWLYLQGQVSRDGYIYDFRKVTPTGTAYANGGELTEFEQNYHEINANYLVGVNKDLDKNFSVNATFGGNSQDNINKSYGLDGAASPFIIPYLYTANNIANRAYTQAYAHYRVNSLYGSADFGFKKYLFLNFTGRNDWFSTLNPTSNHYFYPSVSTSFVFSDAFRLPAWISFGKLRASYAEASNGTSPYQNYLTYGLKTYTINGQSVGNVTNTNIPNSNLKPVKIQEQEIGLNVLFLNNRLGFDIAFYNKKTTDDIATITSSNASGYNAAVLNVGKIRNRGFEGLFTGVPIKTNDFSWNVSFNIGLNRSKVLFLGEGVNSLAIDGAVPRNGDGVTISNVVGMPFGQIIGYAYRRDANGNRVFGSDGQPLRSATVVPLGSGNYKTTGGFSNEFRYKKFTLSCLFDFKYGAKIYSGTNLSLYTAGLQKTTLLGREGGYVGTGVTESGSVNTTAVPAETYWTNLASSNNIAEEFVYDASFIKLRELSLGYTVPSSLLKRFFVKGLQVSFVARNLATLVKHTPNIDPESAYNNTNGQGLESNGYLPTRSFGFNLNLKF